MLRVSVGLYVSGPECELPSGLLKADMKNRFAVAGMGSRICAYEIKILTESLRHSSSNMHKSIAGAWLNLLIIHKIISHHVTAVWRLPDVRE